MKSRWRWCQQNSR
uniref:Uncharacterized protein n=1 Tax=Rhizophora mucronata TaxID=61149 RepID=A0A2P2R0F9_RHIMU